MRTTAVHSTPTPGSTRVPRRRARTALAAVLAGMAVAAAGCGSATPPAAKASPGAAAFKPVTQDDSSPITIWVDATRVAAVKAYQAAHPSVKINMVTYSGDAGGANDLQTKVQLFDRTGSGWPDVVWPGIQDPTWAASGAHPFAAPIGDLISKDTLTKYASGAMSLCTFNGHIYCLRNDLAQNVLWYNKSLMDKFGYTVPTTWEAWEQLGLRVAKEHPGYLVGEVGSTSAEEIYFYGAQCPMNQVTGDKTVKVNLQDPHCTKMAGLLDRLLAANALGKVGKFDTGFIKNSADKILMMPGPAWYGQVVFASAYHTPAGQVAAAPPPNFGDDPTSHTGAVGGGMWMVSSHSKNLKADLDFVQWVTQDPGFTASQGTYPAYRPAAAGWLKNQQASGYFANDIGPVLTSAADKIWSGWTQSAPFSQESIYGTTIVPAITAGHTITSRLADWQSAIENKAKSLGYTVEH
ncbi:ABC transporter substrate-binding protein [Streptomyces sp. NPDC020917]|uniref:ABC transporter substrate-binding protein n=1 Tax=Streptomyces sp. NPDC020917 TaxID=3365102 RepID=UPI0037A94C52